MKLPHYGTCHPSTLRINISTQVRVGRVAVSRDRDVTSVGPTISWGAALQYVSVVHAPQLLPRGQRLQHVGDAPDNTLLQFSARTRTDAVAQRVGTVPNKPSHQSSPLSKGVGKSSNELSGIVSRCQVRARGPPGPQTSGAEYPLGRWSSLGGADSSDGRVTTFR